MTHRDYIYAKYGKGINRKLWDSLVAQNIFDLRQNGFRGRNNDGTDETDATWKAAINIDWTQLVDVVFRFRLLVTEIGAGTASGDVGGQL